MSKNGFLKDLKVKKPCSENWEEMHGNEKVRFCSHCNLHVNNISELTRGQALKLVKKSDGRLCVRYIEHPKTKAPLFADKIYKITRRAGVAAGVLSASLAASSVSYAQGDVIRTDPTPEANLAINKVSEKNKTSVKTGNLTGTITDQTGAVVPGVAVKLIKGIFNLQTTSDNSGQYAFRDIPIDTFEIVFESPGFKVFSKKEFKIESKSGQKLDVTLEVEEVNTTVGAIILASPRLPLVKAALFGETAAAIGLIMKGEKVNARDEEFFNRTALHAAVQNNNLKLIQALIDAGADINAKDESGNTPLMMLDDETSVEIIKLLIQFGANLDVQEKDNKSTALIIAAYNDNFKAMKALIEAGANVNLRDSDGDSALDLIEDQATRQLLITYGAEWKTENK